jgi:hypothetical protein
VKILIRGRDVGQVVKAFQLHQEFLLLDAGALSIERGKTPRTQPTSLGERRDGSGNPRTGVGSGLARTIIDHEVNAVVSHNHLRLFRVDGFVGDVGGLGQFVPFVIASSADLGQRCIRSRGDRGRVVVLQDAVQGQGADGRYAAKIRRGVDVWMELGANKREFGLALFPFGGLSVVRSSWFNRLRTIGSQ